MSSEMDRLRLDLYMVKAERDEARRMFCLNSWDDALAIADQLKWDCFKCSMCGVVDKYLDKKGSCRECYLEGMD